MSEKLLAGRVHLWTAAEGTAAPAPAQAPGGAWSKLGDSQYTNDGVRMTMSETIEETMTLKSTLPQDADRTEESYRIAVDIYDATIDTLGLLLGKTVTTRNPGSGSIGTKRVDLHRGFRVKKYALLLQGNAPYALSMPSENDMYWWWPRVYVVSLGEFRRVKTKQILPVTFGLLDHSSAQAGYVIAKSGDAT